MAESLLKSRLALYTTVYPGVERYLREWYASVSRQTDMDFDLWIGMDGVHADEVQTAIGRSIKAEWVATPQPCSPASIRQHAIARIKEAYPVVIFVDSDDILEPTRVQAAREGLRESDIYGCAIRLMDEAGNVLDKVLAVPDGSDLTTLLATCNVFGLSNTAWRSSLLGQCLPIPHDCVLVDWFLVTQGWGRQAKLFFDMEPHMRYRQHRNNMAKVIPPFTEEQIMTATSMVLKHYKQIAAHSEAFVPERKATIEAAHARAEAFSKAVSRSALILSNYTEAFNRLTFNPVWWACVAHPQLENIWNV